MTANIAAGEIITQSVSSLTVYYYLICTLLLQLTLSGFEKDALRVFVNSDLLTS